MPPESTETWTVLDPPLVRAYLAVINRRDAAGVLRAPEAWESGFKDTLTAYPGEITRIKAKFDLAGKYV